MIIRWVSEDGKRKWIYPVKEDIHTNGKIKKQVSTKAKVIGITKVNIPSPMHPITPYFVLLLEDEFGSRMPKKTMHEYSIGDTYDPKPAQSDTAVVLTKIKYDIEEYLKDTMRLLDAEVKPSDKILIKPSIIEAAYPYQAVCTNPKVIDAIIVWLKEKGITDIIVGEQAFEIMDAAKKSEILDVCKKQNVNFVDLGAGDFVDKTIKDMTLRVHKEVSERRIINVPVLKTHAQLGVAGALENLMRLLHPKTQKEMYDRGIHDTLPLISDAFPGTISIGDASIGLHGQGPGSLGEPAFLNMFYASKNPLALDTVFVATSMLPIPKYIEQAAKLGLKGSNLKEIEIVGDDLQACRMLLKPSDVQASAHPYIKIIDGGADPLTYSSAMRLSQKLFGLAGHDLYLAIGKQFDKKMLSQKRVVAIGKNAIDSLRQLGFAAAAELPEEMDSVEKLIAIKSLLENEDKTQLSAIDTAKAKMMSLGDKFQKKFMS